MKKEMKKDVYKELAEALDRLPEGYPATELGIEIEILKRVFTPEQAQVARVMSEKFEAADEIAKRAGMPVEKVKELLDGMQWPKRWFASRTPRKIVDGVPFYRLRPMQGGGWWEGEQPFFTDPDLGNLMFDYYKQGALKVINSHEEKNPWSRVLPNSRALAKVPGYEIPRYEDLRRLIRESDWVNVYKCGCRLHKHVVGTPACDFPIDVCMAFYTNDVFTPPEGVKLISKEEAIKVVDMCEDLGLIQITANAQEKINFTCFCCGCCCWGLMAYNNENVQNMLKTNFMPVVDHDKCNLCGKCRNICQVYACHIVDGKVKHDYKKCVGCGNCVGNCARDAMDFILRPERERKMIFKTREDWEEAQMEVRQLT